MLSDGVTSYAFEPSPFGDPLLFHKDNPYFEAVLPGGQYSDHFEEINGKQVFPGMFDMMCLVEAPLCVGHITDDSITFAMEDFTSW